jgi:hypothetical protein
MSTTIVNDQIVSLAGAKVTGTVPAATVAGSATTATLAAAATVLATPRAINGVAFDGSAAITVPAAAGTLTGTALPAAVVTSSLTTVGVLAVLTVTAPIAGSVTGSAGSATGNAATATALATPRAINGVNFNGTAPITVPADAATLTGAALATGVTSAPGVLKVGASLLVGSVTTIGSAVLKLGSTGEAQLTIASDTDSNDADTDAFLRFTIDGDVGTLKGLMGYDQGLDRFVVGLNGNAGVRFDGSGNVEVPFKVSKYKDIATAGWGIPAIVASARLLAQAAAIASIAAYTVGAADGSFRVSANVLVTTATTHTIAIQVTYTDESNTVRTMTLQFTTLAGTTVASIVNAAGAVPYAGIPAQIRCKANTTITVKATGTFTTVAFNVEGAIEQLA